MTALLEYLCHPHTTCDDRPCWIMILPVHCFIETYVFMPYGDRSVRLYLMVICQVFSTLPWPKKCLKYDLNSSTWESRFSKEDNDRQINILLYCHDNTVRFPNSLTAFSKWQKHQRSRTRWILRHPIGGDSAILTSYVLYNYSLATD